MWCCASSRRFERQWLRLMLAKWTSFQISSSANKVSELAQFSKGRCKKKHIPVYHASFPAISSRALVALPGLAPSCAH